MAYYTGIDTEQQAKFKQHTDQDQVLHLLRKVVREGWPETKQATPRAIHEYWQFREELSTQKGIVYKAHKIVVPRSLRSEVLKDLHISHPGIEASLRKAREAFYWPKMTEEIKAFVRACKVCQQVAPAQRKEPLRSYDVPTLPWAQIGVDIFDYRGKQYLVAVDFYSDYFDIDELKSLTAGAVVLACKKTFSHFGIPVTIISDNGPQFTSTTFAAFARKWGFRHVTTSPHYSQSNGKTESAVKIAKLLMKKVEQDAGDFWLALLEWRNTPTALMSTTPAQRLMSRRTRGIIPLSPQKLEPNAPTGVSMEIRAKRKAQEKFYNRGAKNLPQLAPGDRVRVQATKTREWESGIVLKEVAPRSYLVRVRDVLLRRNRRFIRPAITANGEVKGQAVSRS
uniref:RNA-directed DNA polymerase n=1 Tax=Trichuris muris TaxID=70415 RepID=A0A5S6Q9Z0_TRIMR